MSKKAFDRIRSLVKGYAKPVDKKFAAEFRASVADAIRTNQLTPEQVSALEQAGDAIARWAQSDDVKAANPIEEWLQLAEATRGQLPMELVESLLARVPQGHIRSVEWSSFVLERDDRPFLRALIEQKLLKPTAFVAIARAEPGRFYRSVALDVLLEKRGVPPREVWSSLEEQPERGAGRMSGPEGLAEAFALDSANDASMWLTEFLAANPKSRSAVLLQILRDAAAVEKLARYFSSLGSGIKGKKRPRALNAAAEVLTDFLDLCVQAVESEKRTSGVATWAVSMIAVGAHSPATPGPSGIAGVVEESLARITRPRLLGILRRADDQATAGSDVIAVSGVQVHVAVHEYLRGLPTGSGEEGPADRAARYQRYLGRKEVMQELIPLLHGYEEGAVAHAALEAALFNVGLRPVGVSEGTDTFDAHRHEPTVPGIIPGDVVRVIRPGWQLGDDENAVVLEKAYVARQE